MQGAVRMRTLRAASGALHQALRVLVAEIVERTGWSRRRFNEMFKADIGMTLKRFSRIRRFQRALQLAGNRGEILWTDIAHA
jgi:AraC-like DNA-binding protein